MAAVNAAPDAIGGDAIQSSEPAAGQLGEDGLPQMSRPNVLFLSPAVRVTQPSAAIDAAMHCPTLTARPAHMSQEEQRRRGGGAAAAVPPLFAGKQRDCGLCGRRLLRPVTCARCLRQWHRPCVMASLKLKVINRGPWQCPDCRELQRRHTAAPAKKAPAPEPDGGDSAGVGSSPTGATAQASPRGFCVNEWLPRQFRLQLDREGQVVVKGTAADGRWPQAPLWQLGGLDDST